LRAVADLNSSFTADRMKSLQDLDRLLESMDVAVFRFAFDEIVANYLLSPTPAGAVMIVQVLSGQVRLCVADRADLICQEGAVILVPPGLETKLVPVGRGEPAQVVAGALSARLSHSFGLLDRAGVPIVEDMSNSPIVGALCGLMRAEMEKVSSRLGARALVSAMMKTTILLVLRRFFQRPGIDQKIVSALADPRLSGAVADIIDRAAAPHSIASLAARVGLSPSSFARHFSAALGMTVMEFVARTRLLKAADLLRSTELPVKVVSARVGFASRSHFSKAFTALHGRDPSAFREAEAPVEEPAGPVDYRRDMRAIEGPGAMA